MGGVLGLRGSFQAAYPEVNLFKSTADILDIALAHQWLIHTCVDICLGAEYPGSRNKVNPLNYGRNLLNYSI